MPQPSLPVRGELIVHTFSATQILFWIETHEFLSRGEAFWAHISSFDDIHYPKMLRPYTVPPDPSFPQFLFRRRRSRARSRIQRVQPLHSSRRSATLRACSSSATENVNSFTALR